MTPDERKAWDELVEMAKDAGGEAEDWPVGPSDYVAILAADAELKRLREDMSEMIAMVPHIGCHDKKNPCAKCFLISELRRKAKEGK